MGPPAVDTPGIAPGGSEGIPAGMGEPFTPEEGITGIVGDPALNKSVHERSILHK